MSQYQTVFDLAQVGYRQWPLALAGLLFVAAGGALILRPQIFPAVSRKNVVGIGWLFVVFASAWTLLSLAGTYADYSSTSAALREGRVSVVEGVVADYASPKFGYERFVVKGVRFEYSDYGVTAGFNNTHSKGGPVQPGARVRITYVEGAPFAQTETGRSIVKLEVLR